MVRPTENPTRLRDGRSSASTSDLAALLQAADCHVPAGAKARVRLRLFAAMPSPRKRRQTLIIAALTLAMGSVAMAATPQGRRLIARVSQGVSTWGTVQPAPRAQRSPTRTPTRPAPPSVTRALETTHAEPKPASPPTEARPRLRPTPTAPKPRISQPPEGSTAVTPLHPVTAFEPASTDAPGLVAEALRALRQQNDGDRSGALLHKYLTTWPQGALAEEAFVLAIEAAQLRKDRVAAEGYAHRYLARYPRGRFVDVARRAQAAQP